LDISSAVGDAAKHTKKHGVEHWNAVKRTLKYVKTTANEGLVFGRDKSMELKAYVDADFASDRATRRSTTGYVVMLGSDPICWKSKQQDHVTTSTTEAEYVALSVVTKEICWLRNLLMELKVEQKTPTKVFEDNQGAIYLSKNSNFKGKGRHIDVAYHFGNEKQLDGTIEVIYCPTSEQVADILTKGVSREVLEAHKRTLGILESPRSLERVGVSMHASRTSKMSGLNTKAPPEHRRDQTHPDWMLSVQRSTSRAI
jgi:hypothetical protein